MASDQVEIDVPASPDAVWALVGDFGGIGGYMPGVESCRVEGDERVVVRGGSEIRERLVARDDAERTIRYSIVSGVPVERHAAEVTCRPQGDETRVTWWFDVLPDQMVPAMASAYTQALETIRRHFA